MPESKKSKSIAEKDFHTDEYQASPVEKAAFFAPGHIRCRPLPLRRKNLCMNTLGFHCWPTSCGRV